MSSVMPRVLIICGAILIFIGLLWAAWNRLGGKYFPLGRLPGDIVIQRPGFQFYFPIVTCLLLSLLISLGIWLLRR